MDIVDVEPILERHNTARPLRLHVLAALDPRREPYLALLCQPHGTISGTPGRIGNADSGSAAAMYLSFLHKAIATHADLVVTPEYSVPWTVLDQIASTDLRPAVGAVWAIGFESISPDQLDAVRAQLQARADFLILYETLDAGQRAQKKFVDPLVYVFWTHDDSGANVLCALVQFKTVASRDDDNVEAVSLCLGTSVYKFNGAADNRISLIGIICSDAFELLDELVDRHYNNLLLLHIQLNRRPGHADFARYRSRLFSVGGNSNVEVLCLNWAAKVATAGADDTPWNTIAGSGWYVAPRNVELDDDAVNALHHAGVYYNVVNHRWHVFYLNYGQQSILLRKQRVFCTGPQALVPRLAPQVAERTIWNSAQATWTVEPADDGFAAFIGGYAPLGATLPGLCGESPLAVERALELLEGPTGDPQTWYTLKELRALKVADEESIQAVTVNQESDPLRRGVIFRRERARRAKTAATIPTLGVAWPPSVTDLAAGFKYRWTSDAPHCNVEAVAGDARPATLVYLGEDPEDKTILNVHARLRRTLARHVMTAWVDAGELPSEALLRAVNQAEDRLCIAYKRNHVLEFYRSPNYASITDPMNVLPADITDGAP